MAALDGCQMAEDPWAAFSPIGATPQQVAPVGAPASADPWAAYTPIDPNAHPPQQKSFVEKLGETWPARIAKGIYSGVTLPGDVMQGNIAPDPSNPEFMGRLMDLSTLGTPLSPRSATSLVSHGAPSVEALKSAADQGYAAVRSSGVEYSPDSVSNLAKVAAQKLERDNFRAGRAPDTHAVLSEMGSPPAIDPSSGGKIVSTIDDLQYAKQRLGDIAADHNAKPADRTAAGIAKRHIENYIQNPDEANVLAGDAVAAGTALRNADKNWAAKSRSEVITGAQDIAEGNAAAANSGRNIDNAYRQRFNSILKSDKQSYGFSEDELARMEALRNGTTTANALRYTGNALAGIGGQAAGAVGAWLYNPALAATPMVGHLLKKGADLSTLRQIKALDEATRMRSALGEEAGTSVSITPAEQLRQTALIKALLSGANNQIPDNQSPNSMIRALMSGG